LLNKRISLPTEVENDIRAQVQFTVIHYKKFINCPFERGDSFSEVRDFLKAHRRDKVYQARIIEVFTETVIDSTWLNLPQKPMKVNIDRAMKTQELLLRLAK